MFEISFSEMFLIVLVGIMVIGPKNLPTMMRTLGQWIARLRNMTTDMRHKSGIDELIRDEGLHDSLRELRNVRGMARQGLASLVATDVRSPPATHKPMGSEAMPSAEREYPEAGVDAPPPRPPVTDA